MVEPRRSDNILLAVENLRVEARERDRWVSITQDISFSLRKGEVLGLVGESGAGKSTAGLAAMGYTRPGCRIASGKVTFGGRDLLQLGRKEKTRLWGNQLAYVAQSAAASFNPAWRLLDQTVETETYWNLSEVEVAKAKAIDLYREMRLPNPEVIGMRFPHQVSGGQLQRIMTAMAMTCRPELIIFDEPTTALDVSTQRDVLIAIREIVEQHNVAAIYISHDLAVVSQMADRVAVMRNGEIVEQGEAQKIIRNPQHEYTKTLWAVRKFQTPMRTGAALLLNASHMEVSYGGVRIVQNVSLELKRGTTVALVGESGSGKTTLGRVLAGLVPHANAHIQFNGQTLPVDLSKRAPDLRRRIQLIYQNADNALNGQHTVFKIIGRPLAVFQGLRGNELSTKAAELLGMVQLPAEILSRYPSELSGGQKQRVAIARAIAANPELIICDEITSALDQNVQEGILRLLISLQESTDVSYLFITHDIATVRAIADEVLVMNAGQIVERGLRDDVLASPNDGYTKMLLDAVPEMDPAWLVRQRTARSTERDSHSAPAAATQSSV